MPFHLAREYTQRPAAKGEKGLTCAIALRAVAYMNRCLIFFALSMLAQAADKPNVVIFFTDDQGTLDAGCYGSKHLHTPNMDRLAAEGVRFTQAYAHTVCCPSRAGLMTGRHPQRGGVNSWTQAEMKGEKGINMALSEVTLAEELKAAGYYTGLFGKWHLGAHEEHGPTKQGFDEFFGILGGFIDNYKHCMLHGSKGFHDLYDGTKELHMDGEYFPELVSQRALKFVEANKQRPFFLCMALNLPHYPEQSLKQHQALFKDVEDEALRSYGSVLASTDHYIGLVLAKLDELKLSENTIVIFMSDNGHSEETTYRIRTDGHVSGLAKDEFYGASGAGNTGKWRGHKGTFYEGGVRVPAIIRYPAKLPKGLVRDQAITVMDWMPTILELCGSKPQAKLDGHSILPLIESADAKSGHEVLHWAWQDSWALRRGEWKLIGNAEKQLELLNLGEEKPEETNHLEIKAELAAELHALHKAWMKEVTP
jgi:arylsulfatase A